MWPSTECFNLMALILTAFCFLTLAVTIDRKEHWIAHTIVFLLGWGFVCGAIWVSATTRETKELDGINVSKKAKIRSVIFSTQTRYGELVIYEPESAPVPPSVPYISIDGDSIYITPKHTKP